jgi:hypothetical protein
MIVSFLLCIVVLIGAEVNDTQFNALMAAYDGLGASKIITGD